MPAPRRMPPSRPSRPRFPSAFVKSGVLPVTKPITITNKGTASVTLAAAVAQASPATSPATVAVDRTSLTLEPAASATLNVSLSGTVPGAGAYSGMVTLTGSGVSMRLPYLFLVGRRGDCERRSGLRDRSRALRRGHGAIGVQLTDANGVPVTGAAVTFSVSSRRRRDFPKRSG